MLKRLGIIPTSEEEKVPSTQKNAPSPVLKQVPAILSQNSIFQLDHLDIQQTVTRDSPASTDAEVTATVPRSSAVPITMINAPKPGSPTVTL